MLLCCGVLSVSSVQREREFEFIRSWTCHLTSLWQVQNLEICPSSLSRPNPSGVAGNVHSLPPASLLYSPGALFQLRLSTLLMWFSCILECRGWITGKSPVPRFREWVCIKEMRLTKYKQRQSGVWYKTGKVHFIANKNLTKLKPFCGTTEKIDSKLLVSHFTRAQIIFSARALLRCPTNKSELGRKCQKIVMMVIMRLVQIEPETGGHWKITVFVYLNSANHLLPSLLGPFPQEEQRGTGCTGPEHNICRHNWIPLLTQLSSNVYKPAIFSAF